MVVQLPADAGESELVSNMTLEAAAPLYIAVTIIAAGVLILFRLYAHQAAHLPEPAPSAELGALRTEVERQRILVNYLREQDMTKARQIERQDQEINAMKEELRQLRAENAELRTINGVLSQAASAKRMPRRKVPATLRQTLTERMNDDELRTLCADLNIAYDDLAGAGKGGRVASLLDYCERHERVDDLMDVLKRTRPELEL